MIAAFASWHENHEAARHALDDGLRLIGHCALETYSVLTRLPPPHRATGGVVRDFLKARFPQPFLRLDEYAYRNVILTLIDRGISGGAAYDALVAATAAGCNVDLVTCDKRALPVYEKYGVRMHYVG